MTQFNSKKWEIIDDDKILTMELTEILSQKNEGFEQTSIYLREDLIQMVHKESNIVLDLGFYGENTWRVYVLERVGQWENPLEDKIFDSLAKSIESLKQLAIKYS